MLASTAQLDPAQECRPHGGQQQSLLINCAPRAQSSLRPGGSIAARRVGSGRHTNMHAPPLRRHPPLQPTPTAAVCQVCKRVAPAASMPPPHATGCHTFTLSLPCTVHSQPRCTLRADAAGTDSRARPAASPARPSPTRAPSGGVMTLHARHQRTVTATTSPAPLQYNYSHVRVLQRRLGLPLGLRHEVRRHLSQQMRAGGREGGEAGGGGRCRWGTAGYVPPGVHGHDHCMCLSMQRFRQRGWGGAARRRRRHIAAAVTARRAGRQQAAAQSSARC